MTIRLLLGTAAIVAVAVFLFGTEPSSGDIASAYLNTFEREAVKAGAKSTERLSGKRLQVESEILLTRAKHEIKVDSVEKIKCESHATDDRKGHKCSHKIKMTCSSVGNKDGGLGNVLSAGLCGLMSFSEAAQGDVRETFFYREDGSLYVHFNRSQ